MKKYFDTIGKKASSGGFTAKQHRSDRRRGNVGFCDGCNTFFQGLSADGARSALFATSRACYVSPSSPLFGSRVVAFIHDEIILETPEAQAPAAAKALSALMVAEMERWLPDIPVKADAHLMRRWYKDAEPVFDAAGELVPWEPKEQST